MQRVSVPWRNVFPVLLRQFTGRDSLLDLRVDTGSRTLKHVDWLYIALVTVQRSTVMNIERTSGFDKDWKFLH
jgi:hypothetical protein